MTAADPYEDGEPIEADHGRDIIARHLANANVDVTARFVNVVTGGKGSYGNHSDAANRYGPHDSSLIGNYGIYATPSDSLVILDVDDYADLDDQTGVDALRQLPPTLEQRSPHGGRHKLLVVVLPDGEERTVAELLADEFDAQNPHPTWGELRAANQYVVGAGSQLDGCDKSWCDECATSDGGRYTFACEPEERSIAKVPLNELLDVLRADPALSDRADGHTTHNEFECGEVNPATESGADYASDPDGVITGDDAALVTKAKAAKNGEKFTDLQNGNWEAYYPSQSEADLGHLRQLAFWTQGDHQRMIRLFSESALADRAKWDRDDYRERTVEQALHAQTTYYDPAKGTGLGDAEAEQQRARADAAADPDETPHLSWKPRYDRELQACEAEDCSPDKGYLRSALAEWFRADFDFMALPEADDHKNGTLYIFDETAGVFTPTGETHLAQLLQDEASPTRRPGPTVEWTTRDVTEVANKIRNARGVAVDPAELNAGEYDDRYIAVENGVLNLDTRELHDHDPAFKFTAKAPVTYDPDATCPHFEQFLTDMTAGDDRQQQTLREWLGFTLTPGYDPQKVLLLYGRGGNGKGMFCRVGRALLGDGFTSSVGLRQMTGGQFEVAELRDARANYDAETPGRRISPEQQDVMKSLSGGDTQLVRSLYETPKGFTNEAKLAFAANEPPRFDENADAIERRLLPVHLTGKFTKDPNDGNPMRRNDTAVYEELTAPEELSGILNTALDALNAMEKRGRTFAIETVGTEAERFAKYMAFADPIYGFACACLDADAGPGHAVTKDAVFNTYKNMCAANDQQAVCKSVLFQKLQKLSEVSWGEYRPGSGKNRPTTSYLRGLWFTDLGQQYVDVTDAQKLVGMAKEHDALGAMLADAETLEAAVRDHDDDWSDDGSIDGETDEGRSAVDIPDVPADATGPEADNRRLLRYLVEREATDKTTPGKGELCGRMDDRHGWQPNHTTTVLERLQTDGRVLRDGGGFVTNL